MTIEPPRGIKPNLLRAYTAQSDKALNSCTKVSKAASETAIEKNLNKSLKKFFVDIKSTNALWESFF